MSGAYSTHHSPFPENDSVWFWSILSGIYGITFGALCTIPTLQSAGFPVHLHIGRQDFYSISYTVSAISLYVSYCSNRSAMFWRNVYSRSNNISHITQESSCEPALYFYTYKSFSSSPICKITASAPAF